MPARVDPDSCGNTNWDADPVAGRHPNASSFADPECNSFGKHIRHGSLLLGSQSWPSARCDAYPDWYYVGLNIVR